MDSQFRPTCFIALLIAAPPLCAAVASSGKADSRSISPFDKATSTNLPDSASSASPSVEKAAAPLRYCRAVVTPHDYEDEIFFAPSDDAQDPWEELGHQLEAWRGGTHLAIDVGFTVPFGDALVERVLSHPKVASVTHLKLKRSGLTPAGLNLLLASPIAPKLQSLELPDALLGVEGAKILASTARLQSLRELNLGRTYLHTEGAKQLARAAGLWGLERLELGYNLIGVEGATALLSSPHFPNLRHLGLAYSLIGNDSAHRLAEVVQARPLECLDLCFNEIDLLGVQALASRAAAPIAKYTFMVGNLDETESARLEWFPQVYINSEPDLPGLVSGLTGGSLPRGNPTMHVDAAPVSLPGTVGFRELWIWEFGIVADYPTFLTPATLPGNGKSRDFAWLNNAGFFVGGHWNALGLPAEAAHQAAMAEVTRAVRGERVSVERLGKFAHLVWRRGRKTSSVTRVQGTDALLELRFFYPSEHEQYFRPIADRCVRSLYFEPGTTTELGQ